MIAYRGAIIGCVAGIFISFYGFNGGAVFFSVALPQNVIITLGIAFAALFNFDYIINKCASAKTDFKTLLKNAFIGFLITLIGAIYEFLITVILIRPMNFYF